MINISVYSPFGNGGVRKLKTKDLGREMHYLFVLERIFFSFPMVLK